MSYNVHTHHVILQWLLVLGSCMCKDTELQPLEPPTEQPQATRWPALPADYHSRGEEISRHSLHQGLLHQPVSLSGARRIPVTTISLCSGFGGNSLKWAGNHFNATIVTACDCVSMANAVFASLWKR